MGLCGRQTEEELDARDEKWWAWAMRRMEEAEASGSDDDEYDDDFDFGGDEDDDVARAAMPRKGGLRDGRGVPRAVRDNFVHDHAGRPCAAGLKSLRPS